MEAPPTSQPIESRSRREEYSDATRRALLKSARARFGSEGFQATSLDDVAADARLTKGAIYHHFESKQALFEAVVDDVEEGVTAAIIGAMAGSADTFDATLRGTAEFLRQCQDPAYHRICFEDGPRALGFQQWWATGERHELVLIRAGLQAMWDDGLLEVDDLDVLADFLFGAMAAASLALARAERPTDMATRVIAVMARVLSGLRPPTTPA